MVTVIDSRGARPAHASPRREPVNRLRNVRALADLAWLPSRPTRDALHPTLLAANLLHRHCARAAGAASERHGRCVDSSAAQPARASPRGERADRTWCTVALEELVRLSSRLTRYALHPTPLAEALLQRNLARSATVVSKISCAPWLTPVPRDPRSLRLVENQPTAHGARVLPDLAWLSLRPTRDALHPTPMADALFRRHLARSVAAASKRSGHCL